MAIISLPYLRTIGNSLQSLQFLNVASDVQPYAVIATWLKLLQKLTLTLARVKLNVCHAPFSFVLTVVYYGKFDELVFFSRQRAECFTNSI